MSQGPKGSRPTGRAATVRVKSARGRTTSSQRWLQRQLNDPYVAEAKKRGYRSRAAFKLIEIDDKHHILKSGARVADLGAAPGGWSQVAKKRVGERGRVVGIDLLDMEAIPGVEFAQIDFLVGEAPIGGVVVRMDCDPRLVESRADGGEIGGRGPQAPFPQLTPHHLGRHR